MVSSRSTTDSGGSTTDSGGSTDSGGTTTGSGDNCEDYRSQYPSGPYGTAVGNVLQDGDTITVIKDLKVKGSSLVVKVGTKVKGIRLIPGDHPIQGKVDGRTVLIMADKVKKA